MTSVELGSQLERYVNSLIETGRYHSKSEVLREGIRLLQDREMRTVALDGALVRGAEDVEAGRARPAEEVFARLERKYQVTEKADRLRDR